MFFECTKERPSQSVGIKRAQPRLAGEGAGARSPCRELEGRALNCANGATPPPGKKISSKYKQTAELKIGVPTSHQRKSTKEQLIAIKGKQHQNADFYCAKEQSEQSSDRRFSHNKKVRHNKKVWHNKKIRPNKKLQLRHSKKAIFPPALQHFSSSHPPENPLFPRLRNKNHSFGNSRRKWGLKL